MKLDVIASQPDRSPWYDGGLSFTCTQCGNCCTGGPGYVWISEAELSRLAEYLKLSLDDVIEKYARRIGNRFSLKERRNAAGSYDCIFLQEIKVPSAAGDSVVHTKRVCSVYPVRPLQCRTWPFWDGNIASKENWRRAGRRCPGIDRGRKFTFEQIEEIRAAKDWPTRPPTSAHSKQK